jgi:hypothetical protein
MAAMIAFLALDWTLMGTFCELTLGSGVRRHGVVLPFHWFAHK